MDESVNSVKKVEGYPSLIDGYLQRQEEDSKIREPNTYYATELAKPCMLHVYWSILEEKEPTKEMLRIFQMGHVLEDFYIQNVLRNTPGIIVLATQLPARVKTDRYEIHGRIDALVLENNKLIIREVKTAKTSSWKTYPNEDHKLQIQFYLNALDINNGLINYIDKTILLLGADPRNPTLPPDTNYPIRRNTEDYADILARAEILHDAITDNEPPEPTENWQCNGWCDWRDKCPAHRIPSSEGIPPAHPEAATITAEDAQKNG